jgi:hypothetical protein
LKLPSLDDLAARIPLDRDDLVRLLDAALEGLRAQPPDSFADDYLETRGELERLLSEAD